MFLLLKGEETRAFHQSKGSERDEMRVKNERLDKEKGRPRV